MEPMDDGANIEWDVAQANNFQDRVVLWSNKMVNSPYGNYYDLIFIMFYN